MHKGGTETHIKELAIRLTKMGHRVDILTTKGSELEGHQYKDIKTWYVPQIIKEIPFPRSTSEDKTLYFFAFLFTLLSIPKFLYLNRKRRYGVVSVHAALEAIIMRFINKFLHIPYVFVFEGYTDGEAKAAKFADFQIAISRDIANTCHSNFGYKPIFIPVGVDLDRIHKNKVTNLKIKEKLDLKNKKIVLTVCSFHPRKDILTLIKAAKIISEKDINYRFIIGGVA